MERVAVFTLYSLKAGILKRDTPSVISEPEFRRVRKSGNPASGIRSSSVRLKCDLHDTWDVIRSCASQWRPGDLHLVHSDRGTHEDVVEAQKGKGGGEGPAGADDRDL